MLDVLILLHLRRCAIEETVVINVTQYQNGTYLIVQSQCRQHCQGERYHLLPNLNALVAVSKGIQAVKLYSNEILPSWVSAMGLL